jgi:hypothetical protein
MFVLLIGSYTVHFSFLLNFKQTKIEAKQYKHQSSNKSWWIFRLPAKEVLQKESGRRLCYIYGLCTSMELFQLSVAPLVLKFGIHKEQAGRKGVRRGEKERMSRGVESQLYWAAVCYPHARTRAKTTCCLHCTVYLDGLPPLIQS